VSSARSVCAHLPDRVIDDIDNGLERLLGNRVSRGFRSTAGRLFPVEVRRASLLHLLLDDWVGANDTLHAIADLDALIDLRAR
jgi:uncharacterized FAD-dependent dehydrogenase